VATFARITPELAGQGLQALETRGLLHNGSPEQARLTEEGRQQAAALLRRHRLSERLFADLLGLPWDRVHEEAMHLEHALTPEAEARLASLLKHPETCPHGGPIPAADGSLTAPLARPLDRVPPGARVWIQQITEEESAFLRYLASLGVLPGAELRVEEVAPFGGPLLVQVGEARYALGRDVAAKILVREEAHASEIRPTRTRRRQRQGAGAGDRTGRD